MECNNISIIGIPKGEEKEKRIDYLFEKIMTENFPNLVKEKNHTSSKSKECPKKMNPKRLTSGHIIIKMAKINDKERMLKAAWEKELVTYKGAPIRLSADFSKERLQARREQHKIFQVMKSKDLQPRLHYKARFSF